jgi:putative phage-type endonuclease
MKILDYEQNSDQWLECRKGKITGSKLKDIIVKRGTKKKLGYYELLADRLAIQEPYEDPMERGSRLEDEALEVFSREYGKTIERVGLCVADDNPDIALSPDGLITQNGKYTEAVEVKCLGSAKHLQAHFEQEIPAYHYLQAVHYFVVIEELETLYFVLYDNRIGILPLVVLELKRADIEKDIEFAKEYAERTLREVDEDLTRLAF